MSRSRCLVVVHNDGYAEAFGPLSLDVRFAMPLHCPTLDDPARGEGLALDVLELMLPPVWRSLYRADNLRANALLRKEKPTEYLARQERRELFDAIDGLANPQPKGGRQWIA